MKFSFFRVPIYGGIQLRDAEQEQEQDYEHLLAVLLAVKQVAPDVQLFASIANREPKWGEHLKTDGQLDFVKYGEYIVKYLGVLKERGLEVALLGPFNEDDFGA